MFVQIDGRRGYVNKAHIQEQRVYEKNLNFKVPTEFHAVNQEQEKPSETEEKQPEETLEKQENILTEQYTY